MRVGGVGRPREGGKGKHWAGEGDLGKCCTTWGSQQWGGTCVKK